MTHLLRNLTIWAVDMAASVGLVILECWRGPVPPEVVANHPAGGRPAPTIPRQRDVSVDDETLELAQHEAIVAVARRHRVLPMPVEALAEVVALEHKWLSPAAEVDR